LEASSAPPISSERGGSSPKGVRMVEAILRVSRNHAQSSTVKLKPFASLAERQAGPLRAIRIRFEHECKRNLSFSIGYAVIKPYAI
jgi:hypothetical protein